MRIEDIIGSIRVPFESGGIRFQWEMADGLEDSSERTLQLFDLTNGDDEPFAVGEVRVENDGYRAWVYEGSGISPMEFVGPIFRGSNGCQRAQLMLLVACMGDFGDMTWNVRS